ncbi:MAG: acetoin utilization protein AcuB [Cyclobacteriaceae bacterium]|jgi:acetoin utilization protein AcuB
MKPSNSTDIEIDPLLDAESTEVSVIMTRELTVAGPEQPIAELRDLFSRVEFHHIPVVIDQKLVGIVSDYDTAKCLGEAGSEVDGPTAQDIMSTELVTADATTSIDCAAILLLENDISCLPIIDDDNRLVGLVTWKDLLRYFVYHER